MLEGVQGQPPALRRRVVAKPEGRIAVRKLVKSEADEDGNRHGRDLANIEGILPHPKRPDFRLNLACRAAPPGA
jgi:hypothetical protein